MKIDYSWLLLKVILLLIIIIGIINLLFFLMKKKQIGFPKSSIFNILSTQLIAPNKYIQLIELQGRLLVIGIWSNGMTLLTEINDKEIIDDIKLRINKEAETSLPFIHYIKEKFATKYTVDKELKKLDENINKLKNL